MTYLVECGQSRREFQSLSEALRFALSECREGLRILRVEPVVVLAPSEVEELRSLLAQEVSRPVPVTASAPSQREPRTCVAVIFDQMFKGFAEVVDRALRGVCVELHEIVGRGLETSVKVGERIYREPARDDYDVLSLAERLAKRMKVVLFTGDKKLAEQARLLDNVYVEYMPPGEFAGKEMAIKHMVEVVKRLATG